MVEHSLLVPFLDQSHTYAYGVELGMQVLSPMLRGEEEVRNYFTAANEEQIRLAAHRLGYSVEELKPWHHKRDEDAQWVWMVLRRMGGERQEEGK